MALLLTEAAKLSNDVPLLTAPQREDAGLQDLQGRLAALRGLVEPLRPADRSCYDADGRIRYDRLAGTALFDDGIRRLIHSADEGRVALMCAEKEPLECHRTLLVARTLAERGVAVAHILDDGRLEDHAAAMDRLLDKFKLPHNGDLFRSRDEAIADALTRQAKRVAYVGGRPPVDGDEWEHAP